jgi:GH25 family lysozyme M1 (1,4-beta-N-acetylmuramidase)
VSLLLGIDVWSGYGVIDWKRAQASGVSFAFLKCTQGNDGLDGKYKANAQGCRDVGLPYAPYLFGYPLREDVKKPGRSPEDQARRLYADCDESTDMPPVLDLEWPPHFEREKSTSKILDRWTQWNVDGAFIAEWGLRCLAEMERLFGRTPILYTYPNFWQSLGDAGKVEAWARYPLWIANYTHPNDWLPPATSKPSVPAPWKEWSVWQFSADGSSMRVPGVPACPLDRNCMREETLQQLLAKDRPVDSIEFDTNDSVCTRR